jgi:hypothetical protein
LPGLGTYVAFVDAASLIGYLKGILAVGVLVGNEKQLGKFETLMRSLLSESELWIQIREPTRNAEAQWLKPVILAT